MSVAGGAGIRSRLDAIPSGVIRLAARRLPTRVRDDLREEWIAELVEVVHGSAAPAASRLLHGLHFAVGLFVGASRISRALDGKARQCPQLSSGQAPASCRTPLPAVGFTETAVSELASVHWVYLTKGTPVPPIHRRPGPRV